MEREGARDNVKGLTQKRGVRFVEDFSKHSNSMIEIKGKYSTFLHDFMWRGKPMYAQLHLILQINYEARNEQDWRS